MNADDRLSHAFAGPYCAKGLARRLRRGEADVLLIDRHVEAGTGGLEPRHVAAVREKAFPPEIEV
ncbi:MAG: hypothetical protein HKO59_17805 [Phycisphaerales bacterium]|nr:hypothetical protein [Phycisphaerae bacterium]NNF41818.1 hypothetical protein [Phycisphaerales bacterium]NNM27797.1 hypothetical protein [Phycisphaerales bacterium]